MGLLIKNYSFNGLDLPSVYAGIEKNLSVGSLKTMNIKVNVWASVEARVKGLKHIHEFTVPVNLSDDEASSIAIFKYVYMKIKELFPDTKDYKDFEQTSPPKITKILEEKDAILIKGTCNGDIKISGLQSMEECEITQKGTAWEIVMTKEVFSNRTIYVSAEEKDCIPSDMVQVRQSE